MQAYKPIRVDGWGDTVNYNLFLTKKDLLAAQSEGTDVQSTYGDPLFVDPAKGDYQVKENSPALLIGFKNFPMNDFGVQDPRLKKMAKTPTFPIPTLQTSLTKADQIKEFLGAKLKEVNGLGDRSAYGLPDENGVIILALENNSIFKKAALQNKDVIRECNGIQINSMDQLVQLIQQLQKTNKSSKFLVIRNQQLQTFEL